MLINLTTGQGELIFKSVKDFPIHTGQDRTDKATVLNLVTEGEMDVVQVMRWLADDPGRIAEFFNRLGAGMWDEWDCGLDTAIEQFGEEEFSLALRSGATIKYTDLEETL